MLLLAVGCGNGNFDSEETVRIGVFEPLSGEYRKEGRLEKEGVEIAHKLYPYVLGKEVELIYGDNMSDISVAETVAQKLIGRRVAVVLGSYGSTLSIAGGEFFERAGIPAISITNKNPLVTDSNDYYFRVCFIESFQGVAVAKYAAEELHATKVAVMRETGDDFSAAVCRAFSDKFSSLTGSPDAIVYTAEYNGATNDYELELQAIKNSGAEAVFLPSDVRRALDVIEQAKKLSLNVVFLGTSDWESDELLAVRDESVLRKMAFSAYSGQREEMTPLSAEFLKAYREKHGEDATPPPEVVLGFDAYILAITSIGEAQTALNGEAVRDCLARTRDFPGVSGNISFDEKGDTIKSVSIMTVENGEYKPLYVAKPVWGTEDEGQ